MQTRTITVDYARPRGYDVGYRAENNFTLLALPISAELEGADSYRVYFESTVGEYLQTELLTPADGYVTVKITSDIVPEPGNMAAQLVAFADGEIVGYAPMITGSAKVSIPDGTERLSHSLAAEIALNTAARHSHENKAVLDKFAESDGKPTYDGKALGGGASSAEDVSYANESLEDVSDVKQALDTIAETQQQHEDDILTFGDAVDVLDKKAHTHSNKTVLDLLTAADGILTYDGKATGGAWYVDVTESGDDATANKTAAAVYAAYEAGYSVYARILIKNIPYAIPLKAAVKNDNTILLGFSTSGSSTTQDVTYPIVTWNGNAWIVTVFELSSLLAAEKVKLYNGYSVEYAINELKSASHSHANKDTLDLLTVADGKLQYNGSDVGLKGDKGDAGTPGKTPVKGTDYWTAADKQEIIDDTLAALPTWTGGNY